MRKLAIIIGRIIRKIKGFLFWNISFLRKYKYHKLISFKEKYTLKDFFKDIKVFSNLNIITCDYCEKEIGIDYFSEKHGWIYEGYHIWRCKKCIGKDRRNKNANT